MPVESLHGTVSIKTSISGGRIKSLRWPAAFEARYDLMENSATRCVLALPLRVQAC
jgi:hypothetical protein